jgi:8-oxo-dGTP pyrophosphatase MutT (NUDIX family)
VSAARTWDDSYEGQIRAHVGSRTLMLSGARAVVRDEAGRILVIRRRDNGRWAFPAGGMELGESILECCVREVREETGLEVIRAVPMAIYSHPRFTHTNMYGNPHQPITMAFIIQEWSGSVLTETEETTDCRFFALDALPELSGTSIEVLSDFLSFDGTFIVK